MKCTVMPQKERLRVSLWRGTCEIDRKQGSLDQFKNVEAVVIGAGMAGMLTAYMLKNKGVNSIVLDAGIIAGGVTQNTTAKITSQHDLIYHSLIESFGEEKAREYANANQQAIFQYRNIIREKGIDCDLVDLPAYLYTLEDERMDEIQKEAQAAASLGIPAVFLDENKQKNDGRWGLPFYSKGAVLFENQSRFHPLKFIKGISSDLTVFEETKVLDVDWNDGSSIVQTDKGDVKTDHVVFACHFPFINVPGYYFLRMHQERSYVLALSDAGDVGGMYIGVDQQKYSFRNQDNYLLLGGCGHRTGENQSGGCYEQLRKTAKKWYPNAKEAYAWSAQDCMSMDGVPYIGQYAANRPGWYVATGFRKWGMTSSMASAMIISDMILRGPKSKDFENSIFAPHRFTAPVSAGDMWKDVKTIGKGLLKSLFDIPEELVKDILPGHGGIVEHEGEKTGVYRDPAGVLHMVEPKCTHMGCQLGWNPEELTWDCPCHGSRFDIKGNPVDNPAVTKLPSVD